MSRAIASTHRRLWKLAALCWLVAAMLLAAWIGLHLRAQPGAGGRDAQRASRATGPLPVFAPGAMPLERVDRVDIRRGSAVASFERRDDGWWQREPFIQPADGAQLRELLVRAADLRFGRRIAAETADLESLGLATPQGELALTVGATTHRIKLGRRGVGGRAWLRIDDGPALSVDPWLHEAVLETDLRRLRSWRIFDAIGADTDRIAVDRTPVDSARAAQRLELVKRDGRWRMESPFATRVDGAAIEALLGALARVEHSGFAEDDPVDLSLYGLEHPIAAVEVTGMRRHASAPGPFVERLEIGSALAKSGAICARRVDRPPIVLLDQTALAALLPPAVAFVDPRPCGIPPVDVRRVSVRDATGARSFELERTLDGWRLHGGDGSTRPARASAVQELLERLCSTRAPELALQTMPPALVIASIEVMPAVGPPVVIRVAREGEADGGKWALDESDDVLRVYPASFDLPLDERRFAASEPPREGSR